MYLFLRLGVYKIWGSTDHALPAPVKSDDSSGETGVEAKPKGKGKGKKGKQQKKKEKYENEPVVDHPDDGDDDPDDIEEEDNANTDAGASGSKKTPKKRPSTNVAKKPASKQRKHDKDWIEFLIDTMADCQHSKNGT